MLILGTLYSSDFTDYIRIKTIWKRCCMLATSKYCWWRQQRLNKLGLREANLRRQTVHQQRIFQHLLTSYTKSMNRQRKHYMRYEYQSSKIVSMLLNKSKQYHAQEQNKIQEKIAYY